MPYTTANFPTLIYGTSIRHGSPQVMTALRLGYRAIDTVGTGAHNEASDGDEVQKFLQQEGATREDMLIQSKFSPLELHAISTCPYSAIDPIELQVLKSFAHSISNLRLDYLDVYFLHRPCQSLEETLRAWSVMEDIAIRGGTRFLGLSQVDTSTVAEVFDHSRIKPAVVQNRHTKRNGFDVEVKEYCQKRNIVYQAYGIMAEENEDLLTSAHVVEYAASSGLGAESALLSLLLAREKRKGLLFCMLDGSHDPNHMQNNLLASSSWSLPSSALVEGFDSLLNSFVQTYS